MNQILVLICITFFLFLFFFCKMQGSKGGILIHRLQASLYCLWYQLGRKWLGYSPHTLCSHVKCKEQAESNL